MTVRAAFAAVVWASASTYDVSESARRVGQRVAAAQSVVVFGPEGDILRNVTPTFVVRTEGFNDADRPLSLRLQISRDSAFRGEFVVDTTLVGDTAAVALTRPLPEGAQLFWRAVALTSTGVTIESALTGPRVVSPWVTLVTPNSPTGSTFQTPRPAFVWSSAEVAEPPGPWRFDVEIVNAGTGLIVTRVAALLDTTFVPSIDLESNVSYRWAVTARLASGDTTRHASVGTFVIVGSDAPRVTILFQNFPNPFPTASTAATCIWFDLRQPSPVRLQVFDIRGNLVRTLLPSGDMPSPMPAGRYGRASDGGTDGSGCDERLRWDGTAHDGRVVPPGVYLLRLYADGVVSTRRIVFRGR